MPWDDFSHFDWEKTVGFTTLFAAFTDSACFADFRDGLMDAFPVEMLSNSLLCPGFTGMHEMDVVPFSCADL